MKKINLVGQKIRLFFDQDLDGVIGARFNSRTMSLIKRNSNKEVNQKW